MLSKILKVMLIVILLPLFAMCSVVALDMGEGFAEGWNEASTAAEAKEKTI